MKEKLLGKIESIHFGLEDGRFGLSVTLTGNGMGVVSNFVAWDPETVKVTKYTKWTEKERDAELVKIMRKISELLDQAKISNINDLVNVPVEIELESNRLYDWRILTEVL